MWMHILDQYLKNIKKIRLLYIHVVLTFILNYYVWQFVRCVIKFKVFWVVIYKNYVFKIYAYIYIYIYNFILIFCIYDWTCTCYQYYKSYLMKSDLLV